MNPFHSTTTRGALSAAAAIIAATLLILACTALLSAQLAQANGNPVAITDASAPPRFIGPLKAGASAAPFQCGHSPYTEVSAYTGTGRALSGQAWLNPTGPFPALVWRDRAGRSVTFDGVTFRNHTARTVLIAGWCS